ncbi:hypothetical protein DICVIV_10404 [Dictyocaulus viviparus]|uniref:Uncharacterized protein n=1 Tax=Dictyocaulus viviparus TaxID=29172 RepID=A0A0D8XIJ3_DICVI|nr:hypothetical protein DICVIV_10404 [Dictyocaulus viviparus]
MRYRKTVSSMLGFFHRVSELESVQICYIRMKWSSLFPQPSGIWCITDISGVSEEFSRYLKDTISESVEGFK